MPESPALSPQLLGQAENAHGAILERILAGTGIGYHHWVALTVASAAGADADRDQLTERLAGALKIGTQQVQSVIAELQELRIMAASADGSRLRLTETGRAQYQRARGTIDEVLGRVYGDIPASDLETAGRVVVRITARANAELASADLGGA